MGFTTVRTGMSISCRKTDLKGTSAYMPSNDAASVSE
jgi:hypothetical protein